MDEMQQIADAKYAILWISGFLRRHHNKEHCVNRMPNPRAARAEDTTAFLAARGTHAS